MQTLRVAAIGLASWDHFLVTNRYPAAGSYVIVRNTLEQSGGTTSNTAHALSKLGIAVTMAAMVGDDPEGQQLHDDLLLAGCDVRHVRVRAGEPSDSSVIVVSGQGSEIDRTIFWQQGARLHMGDALPINELFAHDLVILDVDDPRLRRFIVDLPMHISPRTRILGSLTYLAELPPPEALEIALRHDYLVGNECEFCYVTEAATLTDALTALRARMQSADTRLVAISSGSRGCVVATAGETEQVPAFTVDVVDTTGAGDAFAAGVALGILQRCSPREIGTIANAMGALATRALGARASLPTIDELIALSGLDSILAGGRP